MMEGGGGRKGEPVEEPEDPNVTVAIRLGRTGAQFRSGFSQERSWGLGWDPRAPVSPLFLPRPPRVMKKDIAEIANMYWFGHRGTVSGPWGNHKTNRGERRGVESQRVPKGVFGEGGFPQSPPGASEPRQNRGCEAPGGPLLENPLPKNPFWNPPVGGPTL